ncbi:hypothetical protein [Laspinema olomoucense]|uniref:hypothetical protein n=1 Tax=Laspinema olomoucense TaxID=3231600 RepID=UPI0021BB2A68|nr:hypothetical protein [Laspinema sp. D3d]MCT7974887.1 hypothetical protein [Laspinema sp. D3d]
MHTLTGYVDESLVKKSKRLTKPWSEQTIDVAYRARPLPFYMGKEAQEKTEIAPKFFNKE